MGSSHRPLVFLGIGVLLAGVLAAILFGGIGLSRGGAGAVSQPVAGGDTAPGINPPTGLLLSLTTFPSTAHKPAPNFSLTDQHGAPESMARYRGKVVIFSANDDRCPDLCTLLANDIVAANKDLGPAARDVVWLSVNANPFHPSVSAVRSWTDAHGLGDQPNWHFGTAAPPVLRRVWRDYGVTVELDRRARTVTHSDEMFFIDPTGQERAVANFGTASASTALFAHGLAQMADDLLPASERVHVGGPEVAPPTAGDATVGATAPDFALPYLVGGTGTYRLSGHTHGYTVVNFWSSTCTACRRELPNLESVHRLYQGKVAFVGVDVADSPAPARALARTARLTYPLVSDRSGTAASAERVDGLPFTLILGPGGRILVRHPGAFTTEQLRYVLAGLDQALPTTG